MDNMFGSLGEMFDLNGDGKLDSIEFGVMMEVINGEDNLFTHDDEDEE